MRPTALLGILTGLCTLSLCHTRQYHVVYVQMNWTDAQRYCRARFTDLATVGSLQDVNTVNHTVVDYYNPEDRYAAWIGLYDDIDSWRWSLADQQDHGFRKWAPGEPNNLVGFLERPCCTYMYSHDGTWNDATCAVRLCAICFDDTEPIEKYIFINKSLTWHEAQAHCRERHTDLASVRNQTENEKVRKMIHSDWCWIGLYRDSWKWSDGSSYAFGDWIPGEPSNGKENCVSMVFGTQGSKWEASKCDETRPFICHSNVPEVSVKKQVVRIKVTKSSSLDLNSPAVKEAILELLKQSMMEEGGETADIKLKWVEQSDGKVFHKDKKKRKKRERKPRLTKMEL